MKSAIVTLKGALLTLAGLFVDDGSLALSIALILVVTAFAASTPWLDATLVGGIFVAAVVVALLENIVRSARLALHVSGREGVDDVMSPD